MASKEAAAAEELVQAHTAFRSDLEKLEAAVQPASAASLEAVQIELGALRAHAAEHFRLEERSEWVERGSNLGPTYERLLQRLREEHRDLLEASDTLLGVVQTSAHLDDALREKIHKWIERVQRHECREDDLILESYTRDLGTAD